MRSRLVLITMIAAWLAAMTAVKFFVAPAIVAYGGLPATLLVIFALLATARWLED